jgi:hypothetical protein
MFAKAKKSFADHGINCSPTLDFEKMMERKNTIITSILIRVDYGIRFCVKGTICGYFKLGINSNTAQKNSNSH